MKLKLLPIALLTVVGLSFGVTGCSEETTSQTTTTENPVTTFEISNKDTLQAEWPLNGGDRQITFNIEPAANVNTLISSGELVITSSDTSIVTVLQTYISPVSEGTATITATYAGFTDSVTVTISEAVEADVLKIQEIREGIIDGTYASGDTLSFNGIITATMEQSSTHIYSGVYVQDGDYAIMVYGGQLSTLWLAGEFEIGDTVHVEGTLSPYNGLQEVQPTVFELVDDSSIAEPTVLEITADNFNDTDLLGQDGRLFVARGVTYSSGTITVGSHSTITFDLGTNSSNTSVSASYYVNYHIGDEAMTEMASIVNFLQAGDSVDLYGVISWYNSAQLQPAFLANMDAGDCVISNVVYDDPESITISGDDTLAIGLTSTYTATVSPSTARQSVTWSVDNEDYATINTSTGALTGVSEGTVTVTATSTVDSSISGSKTVEIYEDADVPVLVSAPVDGETYLLRGTNEGGSVLYATGEESGNYLATTTDYNEAGRFVASSVSGVENGWTLYCEDTQEYIYFVVSGNYTNVQMTSDVSEATLIYDAENYRFTNTDGTYYMGARGTYTTFGAYAVSTSYNPVSLYTAPARPTAEAVTISGANTVTVGETITLTATITPAGALGTIEWTSSNTEVATVEDGVVTGISAGDVTITATVSGTNISATYSVSVTSAVEGTVVYSFNLTQAGHGLENAAEYTGDSQGCITITTGLGNNSGDNTTKYYESGDAVRSYGGNTWTFTVNEGENYLITKIEFTLNNTSSSYYSVEDFGFTDENIYISGDVVTHSPGASEIVLYVGGLTATSGQMRITQIDVTVVPTA